MRSFQQPELPRRNAESRSRRQPRRYMYQDVYNVVIPLLPVLTLDEFCDSFLTVKIKCPQKLEREANHRLNKLKDL